ncbi:MAG: deoxyguanosinetriphosphate triphosphohydrolase [Clostridia bacterium]
MKDTVYAIEDMFFSPYAKKSIETIGRKRQEEPCPMRTDFQRDRDRIIHSKAFRRLKNKTQVFIAPFGDHFRTRMTHTYDVAQIARSITRALNLNEDLAEAIALGHDLGHTPFGHIGERTLANLTNGYFKHNEQSVRVVEVLENDGAGLNLTGEVIDGIKNHRSDGNPSTLEGKAVMFADKIAYINHDLDDAIRAKIITPDNLPQDAVKLLGQTPTKRINTMITAIVEQSLNQPKLTISSDIEYAMKIMRDYLFKYIYTDDGGNRDSDKADALLSYLYKHFYNHCDEMPDEFKKLLDSYDKYIVVCDFVAGMSDTYAIAMFKNLTLPRTKDSI